MQISPSSGRVALLVEKNDPVPGQRPAHRTGLQGLAGRVADLGGGLGLAVAVADGDAPRLPHLLDHLGVERLARAERLPQPDRVAFASGSLDQILTAMMAGDGNGGLSPFAKDLVEDVMPMVAQAFKVSTRREDRAIAGLSLGGGQTINLALARPDLFRYVALMSPAATGAVDTIYPQFFKDAATSNQQFKLLWVGVGKDDTLTGPGDRALHDTLTKHGIEHTWRLSDGRHEWTVWRHHLSELAPLLFR